MRHYAIKNKAKLFRLFDANKRPSDIDTKAVSRRTLYQYYGEWRRERGILGRKVGFAVRKYNSKARYAKIELEKINREKELEKERFQKEAELQRQQLETEKQQRQKEKAQLSKLLLDWQAIVKILKEWDGKTNPSDIIVPLPGSISMLRLKSLLRLKRTASGGYIQMTREENLQLIQGWTEIAKVSNSKAEFVRTANAKKIPLPPEVIK